MAISSPRDIADLVIWYSAEAETGYADGDLITGWTDLSGNGNDTVAVGANVKWRSAGGPSSGPVIQCSTGGQGWLQLPANVMSSETEGEVFAWIKSPANFQAWWRLGTAADENWYPFDGPIYDSFGSSTRKGPIAVGAHPTTSWRRVNSWSAASDWALLLDETGKHSTATNTVAFPSDCRIGMYGSAGDTPGLLYAGFVLFSRKLTSGERADMITWMNANPGGGTLTQSVNLGKATSTASPRAMSPSLSLGKATSTTAVNALGLSMGLGKATSLAEARVLTVVEDRQFPLGKATSTATARPLQVVRQFFTPEDEEHSNDFFFGRYGVKVGVTLIKVDGHYVRRPYPWLGELAGLEDGVDYFLGGHIYTLTDPDVMADLEADGFL